MKTQIEQKVLIFERKILRKIFGPNKQADGSCRIKTNEELDKLTTRKNVVREIKSRRFAWLGHLKRMKEHRVTKKITEWKPITCRQRGRPKMRREGEVKHDLKVMKIYHWKKRAKSMNEWKRIIQQAKEL
jgi:hypothetical protein